MSRCQRRHDGARDVMLLETHITMRTVDTTTLWNPPPRTGSAMTGRDSFTIMLARRSVTSKRWPFSRIGIILLA